MGLPDGGAAIFSRRVAVGAAAAGLSVPLAARTVEAQAAGATGVAIQSVVSAGADPTGVRNSTEAFRQALAGAGHVIVPAGHYRLEHDLPIELAAPLLFEGHGIVTIEKSSPSSVPLFAGRQLTGVTVRNLGLVNSTREAVVYPRGERRFRLPWGLGRYAAVAVALVHDDGQVSFLQIGQQFKLVSNATGTDVVLADAVAAQAFKSIRLSGVPGLSPFFSFEDASELTVEGLDCRDGAIEIYGERSEPSMIAVRHCRFWNGQIRVLAPGDSVVPTRINITSPGEPRSPWGVVIEGNAIEGPIRPDTPQRYITFTERVHGIVVQGFARFVTVSGNTACGTTGDGIWLASCADTILTGNRCAYNGLSGIGIENDVVRRAVRCTIAGNDSSFNWFDGIDFNYGWTRRSDDGGPMQVRGAGDLDTALITITGNVMHGNGGYRGEMSGGCGIFANRVRFATFQGNVTSGNYLAGILADACEALAINGNVCIGNGRAGERTVAAGRAGIGLRGTSRCQVAGNILGNATEEDPQQFGVVIADYTAARPGQKAVNIAADGNMVGANSHLGNREAEVLRPQTAKAPAAEATAIGTVGWSDHLGLPVFWTGSGWIDAFGNRA